MQEQTHVAKRKKPVKTTGSKPTTRTKKKPGKTTKVTASNPYVGQNTPVKTNNAATMKSQNQVPTSGFGFGGAVY